MSHAVGMSAYSAFAHTGIEHELDRLSQVSAAASARSKRKSRTGEAEQYHIGDASSEKPASSQVSVGSPAADDSVSQVASQCSVPPTSGIEPANRVRSLNLHSMLFPWWEAVRKTSNFHLRTRLRGNRVGLLIDPGAHDNLVGERTMARMTEQSGAPSKTCALDRVLQVEGVGQNSQAASQSQTVEIGIKERRGSVVSGSFTAL